MVKHNRNRSTQRSAAFVICGLLLSLGGGPGDASETDSADPQPLPLQIYRAEAGVTIAAQGNLALRQIRDAAARDFHRQRPAPLSDLAKLPTRLASAQPRRPGIE